MESVLSSLSQMLYFLKRIGKRGKNLSLNLNRGGEFMDVWHVLFIFFKVYIISQ